jgi:hypothetical protein
VRTLKVAVDGDWVAEYGPCVRPAWEIVDVVEHAERTIGRVLQRELSQLFFLGRPPARSRSRRGAARAGTSRRAARL